MDDASHIAIVSDPAWQLDRAYSVAVVSDSHGNDLYIELAIKYIESSDIIIHLGDVYQDCELIRERLPEKPVLQVRGNTDLLFRDANEKVKKEILVEIGGSKLYCTHGDIFSRSMLEQSLFYRASELGADVALFGHTHCSLIDRIANVLIVNPGSISRSRDGKPQSVALLHIDNGRVNALISFVR